jgi:hypothetical protein
MVMHTIQSENIIMLMLYSSWSVELCHFVKTAAGPTAEHYIGCSIATKVWLPNIE